MTHTQLSCFKTENSTRLQEGQEQVITPIHSQPKEEPKEINIKDYVDMQDNNVVTFVINWIKSVFAKDLLEYVNYSEAKDIRASCLKSVL